MTRRFLGSTLTTQIIWDYGDQDHQIISISINSILVIIMVLLKKDKMPSILLLFFIQMIAPIQEKNLG